MCQNLIFTFFSFSPLLCNLSGSKRRLLFVQVALSNFLIHKLSGLCFFFLLLHRVPPSSFGGARTFVGLYE